VTVSDPINPSLAFRGVMFAEMRLDMKQRAVETKADLENIKEKDDTKLFLEAGHYHRAGDGVSRDTISDSLRKCYSMRRRTKEKINFWMIFGCLHSTDAFWSRDIQETIIFQEFTSSFDYLISSK
jgi:hypothetical protein